MSRKNRSIRALIPLMCVVAGAAIGIWPGSEVRAQAMIMGGGPGGPGGRMMDPPVSSRELERYAKALGLDAEQHETAKTLLEAMQAEHATIAAKQRDEMAAIREEFEETRDPAIFRDKMPEIMRKSREVRGTMEKSFFDDLRAIINDQQAAAWPVMERMRRRDQGLPRGRMSGESIDLLRVVDDLKLAPEARAGLAGMLDQYEIDLDRALGERTKVTETMQPMFGASGAGMGNEEEIRAKMAEIREASKQIRDVNARYARQLNSALPAEVLPAFEKAIQRESFPQVYRESYAKRAMQAAADFSDLTPDQRSSVRSLLDEYEREAAAINSKWAAAIRDTDEKGGAMFAMPGGGAFVTMREGEGGAEDPTEPHRAARRKLDERMEQSLKSALNDEQRSRLPERRRQREGDDMAAGDDTIEMIAAEHRTVGPHGEQSITVQATHVGDGEGGAGGEGGNMEIVVVQPGGGEPPKGGGEAPKKPN